MLTVFYAISTLVMCGIAWAVTEAVLASMYRFFDRRGKGDEFIQVCLWCVLLPVVAALAIGKDVVEMFR